MATKEQVFALVNQLDPTSKATGQGFMVAAIMLAAISEGADESEIAALLEYAPEFVAKVGERLRENGIWDGLKTTHKGLWQDEDTGGISFWMDANVGLGDMLCSHSAGEPQYSMTAEGTVRIEKMLRGHSRG